MNTLSFIAKAIKIHGAQYNYSLVNYTHSKATVCIICSIHGRFNQRAATHLSGHGCPKCGRDKLSASMRITNDEFIKKAQLIHNYKYNYSECEYMGSRQPVKIICPVHGVFIMKAIDHLTGRGCNRCNNPLPLTTEEFKKKGNLAHKGEYSYNRVTYKNTVTPVCIICPIHGEFNQKPSTHLSGHGCPKCARKEIIKKNSSTTKEFVKKAQKVHGTIYDYSKVKYKNSNTKVAIKCNKHDVFYQTPSKHLMGRGCPHCNASKGEIVVEKYLTDHNIQFEKQKTLPQCILVRPLRFDFFIPSMDIAIEYDGIQHFKPVKWLGGKDALLKVQQRDKEKNKYCFQNNIQLIRIPYSKFKSINKILNESLNHKRLL